MKNKIFLINILAIILLFASCSKEEEEIILPKQELSAFEMQVINYFIEVALGFEDGSVPEITRKWWNPMKIFVGGNPSTENMEKVEQTLADINELATDGFSVEMVSDSSSSNCYLFFGSNAEFRRTSPNINVGSTNFGYFYVWWQGNNINRARIFVDTQRANLQQQQSLILEEITQALGLGKDSPRYPGSIFYETANDGGFATEYSDLDREVVRLLYHPNMRVGLNAPQVNALLTNILKDE
ncbi:MAG: DUF2927 domain-containing protein [Bacteroidota bacterium]